KQTVPIHVIRGARCLRPCRHKPPRETLWPSQFSANLLFLGGRTPLRQEVNQVIDAHVHSGTIFVQPTVALMTTTVLFQVSVQSDRSCRTYSKAPPASRARARARPPTCSTMPWARLFRSSVRAHT